MTFKRAIPSAILDQDATPRLLLMEICEDKNIAVLDLIVFCRINKLPWEDSESHQIL